MLKLSDSLEDDDSIGSCWTVCEKDKPNNNDNINTVNLYI